MAFECSYSTILTIYHKTWTSEFLSAKLSPLEPTHTRSVGESYQLRSGAERTAKVSVWEKRMHEAELIDGESVLLDDHLLEVASCLRPFSDVFATLPSQGRADLAVHFLIDSYAVATIQPSTLARLAECGVRFVIEMSSQGHRNTHV